MPNFDCGGDGCRTFSCASCTDEKTRAEYWKVLSACRSDADADKIMRERLAKKRARANALRAENERLRAALEAVMGACDAECAGCGAYYVAKRALDGEKEKP